MTGPHLHKHKPIGEPVTLAFLRDRTVLDQETGCWLWTGAIIWSGYGRVRVGTKTQSAHRCAYMLATGLDLPRTIDVCHRCDVRACINPDHLFHGTRRDNMRDCANKGRTFKPGDVFKGELCPAAKLTADQVRAIRTDGRSTRVLGALYGVSRHTISAVKRGLTWRSI